jgi:hypothetical protein
MSNSRYPNAEEELTAQADTTHTAAPSLKIRDSGSATKAAGIVTLIAGGFWSVLMFHETAKQQASAAVIDAQKPFATKRLRFMNSSPALRPLSHGSICPGRSARKSGSNSIKS